MHEVIRYEDDWVTVDQQTQTHFPIFIVVTLSGVISPETPKQFCAADAWHTYDIVGKRRWQLGLPTVPIPDDAGFVKSLGPCSDTSQTGVARQQPQGETVESRMNDVATIHKRNVFAGRGPETCVSGSHKPAVSLAYHAKRQGSVSSRLFEFSNRLQGLHSLRAVVDQQNFVRAALGSPDTFHRFLEEPAHFVASHDNGQSCFLSRCRHRIRW